MAKNNTANDGDNWNENPDADQLAKGEPKQSKQIELRSANDVVVQAPMGDLRQLSFEDMNRALGVTDSSEAIGTDQFGPILEDKRLLLGRPFVLVHWNFYKSDKIVRDGVPSEFASMWVLTSTDERYIVNDGSTGIYEQLRTLTDEKGIDSGVLCKHGLRVSEYDYTDEKGVTTQAATFYIDTKL